jgi:hypothetical protein
LSRPLFSFFLIIQTVDVFLDHQHMKRWAKFGRPSGAGFSDSGSWRF